MYKVLRGICGESVSFDLIALTFKIIITRKLKRKPNNEETVSTFEDVMSMFHIEQKNDLVKNALVAATEYIPEQYRLSLDDTFSISQKINFNSYGISDVNGENIVVVYLNYYLELCNMSIYGII